MSGSAGCELPDKPAVEPESSRPHFFNRLRGNARALAPMERESEHEPAEKHADLRARLAEGGISFRGLSVRIGVSRWPVCGSDAG